MMNEFKVQKFKKADVHSVINVFNSQLGDNYITPTYLTENIKNKTLQCVVIKEEKSKEVVGVCLYGIIDYQSILKITKGRDVNEFKKNEKIGFIKTIAVLEKYQHLGLGTKMLEYILDKLSLKITNYISTAWEYFGVVNVSHLLEKFGFVKLFTLSNYWYEDSVKEKFQCPYCGNPCYCNCIIYIKY